MAATKQSGAPIFLDDPAKPWRTSTTTISLTRTVFASRSKALKERPTWGSRGAANQAAGPGATRSMGPARACAPAPRGPRCAPCATDRLFPRVPGIWPRAPRFMVSNSLRPCLRDFSAMMRGVAGRDPCLPDIVLHCSSTFSLVMMVAPTPPKGLF